MANQVPFFRHRTSCPARCHAPATALAAVTLGGAYAAVPVRRVYPARLNVYVMFDGGMWGLGQAAGDRLRQT